jgi:hypothetical protein
MKECFTIDQPHVTFVAFITNAISSIKGMHVLWGFIITSAGNVEQVSTKQQMPCL